MRYVFEDFSYAPDEFRLSRSDDVLPLPPLALTALAEFLTHPGALILRESLLELLWPGVFVSDNSVAQVIAKLRRALGDNPRSPRFIETVSRRGYRWLAPVSEIADERHASQTNLPSADPSFLGQLGPLAQLSAVLEEARLATVLGPGGVGKTRLVRHLGIQRAATGEAVWFCDLTPARDLRGVVDAVRAGLALAPSAAPSDAEALRQLVAALSPDALIILDNAEQVATVVATLAGAALEHHPHLRLLVTSRERLKIAAERAFELRPMEALEAMALLRQRAEATRAGLGELDDEIATALVQRLEGMPLAITLAAPRLALMSGEALHQRLASAVGWLTGRDRDLPSRHRSLGASVAWSWALLELPEQGVAAQAAVFRGGFTLEAAEAVLRTGEPTVDVDDALLALRDASMLQSLTSVGEPRFSLLEPIREYALEQLRAAEGEAAARERHVDWLLAKSERDNDTSPLRDERENLWVAWEHAASPAAQCRLADQLYELFFEEVSAEAMHVMLTRTLERTASEHPALAFKVCYNRALLRAYQLGNVDGAERDADWLDEVAGAGTHSQRGYAAVVRGVCARCRRDPSEREHLVRALGSFRLAGDRRGEVRALGSLSLALLYRGDYPAAEAHLEEALSLARVLGDTRREVGILGTMARVFVKLGRTDDEERVLRESLAISEAMGAVASQSNTLRALADTAHTRGRLEEAEELAKRAMALATTSLFVASAGFGLARIHLSQCRYSEALAELTQASAYYRSIDAARQLTSVVVCEAFALALAGDREGAAARSEILDDVTTGAEASEVFALLVTLALATGRPEVARTHLQSWTCLSDDERIWRALLEGALAKSDGNNVAYQEALDRFDGDTALRDPMLTWTRRLV